MTAARLAALAKQHNLDLDTSQGRVALIKEVRRADPRLSLVEAKTLVDGLRH